MRRLRRPAAGDAGRPGQLPTTDADRAIQSERARFASTLDLELRLACRSEAAARRELGEAARTFVRGRAYRRLGFVRLSDYARERLGVSARSLQIAAWLATRLDELPAISSAYDRSELSWTAARAICKVAVAADQEAWLALARRSTVDTLERLVARARHPDGVPADPDGDPNEIDGEPAVRWRFACPARVRALWRRALALTSRAAGEPLAAWRAVEIVAAEASSGRPSGMSMGDRVLLEALRLARRARRRMVGADGEGAAAVEARGAVDPGSAATIAAAPAPAATFPAAVVVTQACGPRSETPAAGSTRGTDAAPSPEAARASGTEAPCASATDAASAPPADTTHAPSDPFALDARLAEAMRVVRTLEPRIGRLLRVVVDHRLYRSFGYRAFDAYVRERLGIAVRKAWALLTLEKATLRSAEFDRAYRAGDLSWVRALALLPVLDRETAPAWIVRAESVTVRRLCDEVEWVLTARDALGSRVALAPPPVESRLASPVPVAWPAACRDLSPDARLQIRAHEDRAAPPPIAERQNVLEVADAEIRFTGPASVVALLRDVLDAFATPEAPRWTALERVLRHVVTHWERTPRHHDPVFARDGWRCTVPACSSRRNLHDHHIRFRSRGGDNRRDNRTAVCAAHHLHGLHDGTIHASGVAPHAIEWRLGVRPGAPPYLTYVGDRLSHSHDAGDASHAKTAATDDRR